MAIFHAFNMKYEDITKMVDKIASRGYTHIQISPAQKSRIMPPHTYQGTYDQAELWWLRYQPIDFLEINNFYGNARDLQNLTGMAKEKGINIIADVVFNHVAALQSLERGEWGSARHAQDGAVRYRTYLSELRLYPHFSMARCEKKGLLYKFIEGDRQAFQECMEDFTEWEDCKQRDKRNPESRYTCWMDAALPSLRPTKDVLGIHAQHIDILFGLGVRGFRFDAVKNISPETLQSYVHFIKKVPSFTYLEFVGETKEENAEKTHIAPVTDFVFLHKLRDVFKYDGDLRVLRNVGYDPGKSILFAENHDTAENRKDPSKGINAQITDKRDMELAITYLLGRHGGVPLILAENAHAQDVPTGVLFRRIMDFVEKVSHGHVQHPEYIHDIPGLNSKEIMVMIRENGMGIYILNKSGEEKRLSLKTVSEKGPYALLKDNGHNILATPVHDEIVIPARAATYLVEINALENLRKHDPGLYSLLLGGK